MEINCPIRSIDLPGASDVQLQGLIVVVGPNSSGKTQLLYDLNEVICGRRRNLVVASSVSLQPPVSFDQYFAFLIQRRAIRETSVDTFQKRSLQYGTDEGGGKFHKSSVQGQYQQLVAASNHKIEGAVPEYAFLRELGALTCSALFLKNRLTLMDPCPAINHTVEAPSKTLQALYLNKGAKEALRAEISQVFHRAVWVDGTRIKELVFRAADSPGLPSPEDRLEPETMEKYRTIETEGDGLRSYSAICATLLLEERPLCLIDEPETCLHPPQAHAMGRFIGTNAPETTCTMVATHSSHVLRGILETRPKPNIVRLSRSAKGFQARTVTPELLEQVTSKPRSRSEAILEGLFSQGVVLCEAEGDRIVYESTYRTLQGTRTDVRFTACEGTGGFGDPLRLYKALEVPSAVIADLDFVSKKTEIKTVLLALGTSECVAKDLLTKVQETTRRMRACSSVLDPSAIQSELKTLSEAPIDLSKDEDIQLRGKLRQLADRLYRFHDIHTRGIDAIPEEYLEGNDKIALHAEVQTLIDDLKQYGLFLVHVGELESWLPILMKGQSREDKSKWAMLAAEKIEDVGERKEDVWLFMRSVHEFFEAKVTNAV